MVSHDCIDPYGTPKNVFSLFSDPESLSPNEFESEHVVNRWNRCIRKPWLRKMLAIDRRHECLEEIRSSRGESYSHLALIDHEARMLRHIKAADYRLIVASDWSASRRSAMAGRLKRMPYRVRIRSKRLAK